MKTKANSICQKKMLQGLFSVFSGAMYDKHSLLMFNSRRMLFVRMFDKLTKSGDPQRDQCSSMYHICIVYLKIK